MYTAAVIMKLYEEGKISLDDPMPKYLPKKLISNIHIYEGTDYSNKITVRQLLSHTSGIPDYYHGKQENGKSFFEMLLENPNKKWSVDDTIGLAKDLNPNFKPGTDIEYSDTNFQLLGKIIEKVTELPLQRTYSKYIFIPLGLKKTYLVNSQINIKPADVFYNDKNIVNARSNEAYWADGGIISTPSEMIIFLKALNNGKIISKSTLKLMHDWHDLNQFPFLYGYGIMKFKLPWFTNLPVIKTPPYWGQVPHIWGHSGSTGSFLYYSPKYDIYIAGTSNQVKAKIKPFGLMTDIMNAIK